MSDLLKLSDASSLAFHALALLTQRRRERISAGQMAELFGASEHTLAKVMQYLVRAGFVDSVRGAGGGFSLIIEPGDVTLLMIYEAVDGPLRPQRCLLGKPVCNGEKCVMQGLLGKLHGELHDYFARTRLNDLALAIKI